MVFKRIEIFGFKSFADKVVIDINDGITGIVGPNGCGKSNFSEAIKWVLGEQRPGELRAKSMSDIIFSGTERRGAMSYCEISLVFDNTARLFPSLEFDEVTISRKLYRNGDSEYLINKVACKLKNIRSIIFDTGLGRDGYSIIGQGRVEQIITSKPEARRNVFEDAAGITKFKVRKIEAEKKLALTHDHLDRLGDIIREIERQLGPLSKQSEDAKKYNEYYNELKDLEVNHYLYTAKKNIVDKNDIATKLTAIGEESAQIQSEIKSFDAEYSKLLIEINNTDALITNLRNEQTEMMVAEERRLGVGNVFGERLANYKNENIKLNENIERMNIKLAEIADNIAATVETAEDTEKTLNSKRVLYTDYENEYNKITSEMLDSENELESSSRAILQAVDELAGVKADMSKLGAENGMLQEKLDETLYIIERTRKQIEIEEANRMTVNESLNASKTLRDRTYKELVQSRNRANELKLEQNSLNESLQSLAGSISSLETKTRILSNIREQYEGYFAPVQRLMQEAKKDYNLNQRILGVVAELIKVPEKLEVAIETALGGALQNIVTETDDDVKYMIDVLKRNKMGRLTFLPINTFKSRDLSREFYPALRENGCLGIASQIIKYDRKYNSIMGGLLGSTVICDNYDNAIAIFKKYRSAFKIVTLEGEVLSVQGSISGGSKKNDNANILSQEREIEQSKVLYAKAKSEYEQKCLRLQAVKSEYEELNNILKDTQDVLTVRESTYATETEREDKLSERIEQLLQELTDLNNAKEKLEDRLGENNIRLSSTDRLEGNIKDKRANVDDIKNKSKLLVEDKKVKKDDLSGKMTASRVELAELEGKYQNINDEIERFKQEGIRCRDAINEDKSALATILAMIKQTEDRINNVVMTSKDKARFDEIKEQLAQSERYKQQINQNILFINMQKDEKNTDLMSCAERRIKEESNLEKIDSIMQAMVTRLEEEYGLTHEASRLLGREDFDDYGVPTQIANVKRNISKLGAINPSAIEQYALEGERHLTLTTERDDLLKAEEDLQTIIRDLSKEMLERFQIEFAKISSNFEVIFREIFGGGKGELVLDKDAEDPLSAGVEILAQPPGKKLGQITLFSGGEKALTAIAILFAILKTKPMPFCVLDEIEAALDETNARLFAKYLKRFTHDTQFIVITHRKPTMEQADRLYGVTMEEKGVSRVVSVELNEAVKTAEPLKVTV